MGRYPAPSLLEALNRPERGSEELGHFLLGFSKSLAEGVKFLGVHKYPYWGGREELDWTTVDIIYHGCY